MCGEIVDFRKRKRTKEITIVLTSDYSFGELENVFYISGYSFNFVNIVDNHDNGKLVSEIIVNVKRKNNSFDPLIEKIKNDNRIKNMYINDTFKRIKGNDN